MSRLPKVLLLAALALAATASSGTAASPARAPLLGVVPHAGGQHPFGTLAAAPPHGPLFLHASPCALTSSPHPRWTMRTNTTHAIYWVPSGLSVHATGDILTNRY